MRFHIHGFLFGAYVVRSTKDVTYVIKETSYARCISSGIEYDIVCIKCGKESSFYLPFKKRWELVK